MIQKGKKDLKQQEEKWEENAFWHNRLLLGNQEIQIGAQK